MDPRGLKKEEWEWAELNAFHNADVARALLLEVDTAIADAEYLRKKEAGEMDNKFDKYWKKDA